MADRLATYAKKRDFRRTPEPAPVRKKRPSRAKATGDGTFVVQKHDASRLHYDFRLGIGGVLVSWAVPKGPSMDPGVKRLAVRTEDHPMDYGGFEGVIPKGEYGGGSVMLWDRGRFTAEGDPAEGLAAGELKVRLEGERLEGGFVLVRLKRKKGEGESWLLIKERGEGAGAWSDIEALDTSVATGRSMEAIAESGVEWDTSKGGAEKKGRGRRATPAHAFIAPQLATLVAEPPKGKGWLYEPKLDGYRMLAAANGRNVRCYTRSGQDWTDRFAPIAAALEELDLPDVYLDGEVVVADKSGRTSFGALQRALGEAPEKISYQVFDCLFVDGEDLRDRPNTERKARLERVLKDAEPPVQVITPIEGDGAKILKTACGNGLEGIVAKKADAPYRSRRVKAWLKLKCVLRQELVIGGWSPSERGRAFASLLLGAWDGDQLRYAGRVGTGFDEAKLKEVSAKLAKLARKTNPFVDAPADQRRRARWVEPKLVAEVRYGEMTSDRRVRHGVFLGLREDKDAREIRFETPSAVE